MTAITRRDYDFTIYESPLIRLPPRTRKAVVIGPPGSTYKFQLQLSNAGAAARLQPGVDSGVIITATGAAVTETGSSANEFWPRRPGRHRIEVLDDAAYLNLPLDITDNAPPPISPGDYQLFAYPADYTERGGFAEELYIPIQSGRISIQPRPPYTTEVDFIDNQLRVLRQAATDPDRGSAALMEVELPDGSRQRFAGLAALLDAIHNLEQRRAWLIATNHGRRPIAGFVITDH